MPATFSCITEGIRVNVHTTYVPDESSPKHKHFVFAYMIEITNESPYPVQLRSRVWHIVDALGGRRHVEGEGVVGEQPVIAPGERYSYVSGSHFPTPIGQMKGHYRMQRLVDGGQLEVAIPAFTMTVPCLLN
ncbi:MAG: Co2+/Mg2+ efflux protein ApaG [Bacteroidia bacterium]